MENLFEIKFGDVFLSSFDGKTRYVIVDVCEENWFYACQIIASENRLGIAGTSEPEYVLSFVGSMSFDEIIEGIERTVGKSDNIRDILLVNSKKGARTIKKV